MFTSSSSSARPAPLQSSPAIATRLIGLLSSMTHFSDRALSIASATTPMTSSSRASRIVDGSSPTSTRTGLRLRLRSSRSPSLPAVAAGQKHRQSGRPPAPERSLRGRRLASLVASTDLVVGLPTWTHDPGDRWPHGGGEWQPGGGASQRAADRLYLCYAILGGVRGASARRSRLGASRREAPRDRCAAGDHRGAL